jgi:hypothetical protein
VNVGIITEVVKTDIMVDIKIGEASDGGRACRMISLELGFGGRNGWNNDGGGRVDTDE